MAISPQQLADIQAKGQQIQDTFNKVKGKFLHID